VPRSPEIMILGLYGALTPPWKYLTLIGLVPFGTALTGFLPGEGQALLPRRRMRSDSGTQLGTSEGKKHHENRQRIAH
jgi:hypothetical protein